MKRFLLTLAVLMASITTAFAEVYSGSCGANVTYTLDTETGVLKIEGTGAMSDYSYSSLNGVYVTTAPWRDYYRTLKSVTISQGVTSIGECAFLSCSSLTSITIPNSVTSIGNAAFRDCSSLTSITIPESVTSIGEGAFSGCSSLASIVVDPRNTKYDSREGCNAIIETSTNTLVIGCKSSTIPSSVTSIGSSAFENCSSLTSITIPESVTRIGSKAFRGCI